MLESPANVVRKKWQKEHCRQKINVFSFDFAEPFVERFFPQQPGDRRIPELSADEKCNDRACHATDIAIYNASERAEAKDTRRDRHNCRNGQNDRLQKLQYDKDDGRPDPF